MYLVVLRTMYTERGRGSVKKERCLRKFMKRAFSNLLLAKR